MNAVREGTQSTSNDELIEYMLRHCYQQMVAAKERDQQLHWWTRMGVYIRQRSPARIQEMERERGLA